MLPPPPRSTLFPYTTLFRSRRSEIGEKRLVTRAAVLLQELRPAPPELALRRAPEERVALPDERQVLGVQLLRLHQDLLAHADLAEIVEQPGVADLPQLLAGERHVPEGAVRRSVHA